jgi:hypothetical protein
MQINPKHLLIILIYIAGQAFGWCLISFCLMWALLVGFKPIIDLLGYAAAGLILIIISKKMTLDLTK